MCQDCGCMEPENTRIDGKPIQHDHHHGHDHDHDHHDTHEISIRKSILEKNNHIAEHNRDYLSFKNILCTNWISAPGSGKTAILERIIKDYSSITPKVVIEGDQQTDNDTQRIRQAGGKAIQINTGAACHLDADMVNKAIHAVAAPKNSMMFIENVGNMVCPTAYDLGEAFKIAVISTPEGEDKPVKYPDLILTAKALLINKIDIAEHVEFDTELCVSNAKKINPEIKVFLISAKTGSGVSDFYGWLQEQQQALIKG